MHGTKSWTRTEGWHLLDAILHPRRSRGSQLFPKAKRFSWAVEEEPQGYFHALSDGQRDCVSGPR